MIILKEKVKEIMRLQKSQHARRKFVEIQDHGTICLILKKIDYNKMRKTKEKSSLNRRKTAKTQKGV